jgi:hypothetical protein
MSNKFDPLAWYNAECSRGIVHTPEYDARMADLQREWNEMEALPSRRSGSNQTIMVDPSHVYA